jgi:hypothetical protein
LKEEVSKLTDISWRSRGNNLRPHGTVVELKVATLHTRSVRKLFDESGEGMTPSHAVKGDCRYRYYVSRSLMKGPAARVEGGWRLPAAEIERSIAAAAQSILDDQQTVLSGTRERRATRRACRPG